MGPRPRGRGVNSAFNMNGVRELASMGPRPRGRGVTVRMLAGGDGTSGFNGAAPARARSCLCGQRGALGYGALQWGRARAGAEFPSPS